MKCWLVDDILGFREVVRCGQVKVSIAKGTNILNSMWRRAAMN
jgi:hypothetical protein